MNDARMAESVDALVSNTNVRKDVPVRPRLRVQCTKGVLFREKLQRKVKNIVIPKIIVTFAMSLKDDYRK